MTQRGDEKRERSRTGLEAGYLGRKWDYEPEAGLTTHHGRMSHYEAQLVNRGDVVGGIS